VEFRPYQNLKLETSRSSYIVRKKKNMSVQTNFRAVDMLGSQAKADSVAEVVKPVVKKAAAKAEVKVEKPVVEPVVVEEVVAEPEVVVEDAPEVTEE
jgi:hypothetical protein